MKTKQIPDDFRDWIEARTFETSAPIAWPTGLPLDYLKRIIIRQPAIRLDRHCFLPILKRAIGSAWHSATLIQALPHYMAHCGYREGREFSSVAGLLHRGRSPLAFSSPAYHIPKLTRPHLIGTHALFRTGFNQ